MLIKSQKGNLGRKKMQTSSYWMIEEINPKLIMEIKNKIKCIDKICQLSMEGTVSEDWCYWSIMIYVHSFHKSEHKLTIIEEENWIMSLLCSQVVNTDEAY